MHFEVTGSCGIKNKKKLEVYGDSALVIHQLKGE